jgi:dephospho-CoA kinase
MKPKINKTKIISITGDIASGKSALLDLFRDEGFPVFSADIISRMLYETPTVIVDICTMFDMKTIEGRVDKRKLREIVFSDPTKLLALEGYLHPLIVDSISQIITSYRESGECSAVFFEIPLLFEKKLQWWFDINIVVKCDLDKKIARIVNRDNCSTEEAKSILDKQMLESEKIALADVVFDNNKDLQNLQIQVNNFLLKIK